MRNIKNTYKSIQPLIKAEIAKNAGIKTAKTLLNDSAHNITNTLLHQNPNEYNSAIKTIQKELEIGFTTKTLNKSNIQQNETNFKDIAKEIFSELVKDQISSSIREYMTSKDIKKFLLDDNKAKLLEQPNIDFSSKVTTPLAEQERNDKFSIIQKIDSSFKDEVVSLFNSKISELSVALVTSSNNPEDIKVLNKQITELEQDRDLFFDAQNDPERFVTVCKDILDKFSGNKNKKDNNYNLSKERKIHIFSDGLSPKISAKAEQLQERLLKIKSALH